MTTGTSASTVKTTVSDKQSCILACAGRWEARIGVPGSKHIYLGLFASEREAAKVCASPS